MLRTGARSFLSTILRSPRNARSLTSGPLKLKDTKYTAVGIASGAGRNGQTECNGLKLQLATPKELGGTGQGENPEQLFAMGYSACFLGALQAVAARAGQKDKIVNAVVNAKVHLGEPEGLGGFGIGVELEVSGAPKDLVDAAHEFCPYSRSLKYGVDVTAKVV
ncbi:OsmC-domain-containing protein [Pleurotus eryngii]|uniref:OsmC-domain-containing protein n=1 Tax=Pleurotus eryngii TaxID=5323 RepID=A0A9P6DL21_PLEER|nr:OsmC-domain-containing protein [Pleurotus eryngii]